MRTSALLLPTVCSVIAATVAVLASSCDGDSRVSVGLRCGRAVTGKVWHDLDCDGTLDADEPGLEATLRLTKADGEVVTITTEESGSLDFSGLCEGKNVIEVVEIAEEDSQPMCLTPTKERATGDETISSARSPVTVMLSRNQARAKKPPLVVNFGYCSTEPGKVVGSVQLPDPCGAQVDSAAPGIGGATIVLISQELGIVAETVTETGGDGVSGRFEFSGLCAGKYTVRVIESTLGGCLASADCSGAGDDGSWACNPATFELTENDVKRISFGFCSSARGVLGDRVWLDENCNGLEDPGEEGINGVTIKVVSDDGVWLKAVTATDGSGVDGHWKVSGLCVGRYKVIVDGGTLPACVKPGSCVAGDPACDSTCPPVVVTLPTDESEDTTIDFGFCPADVGVIGDRVWLDENCNGLQDPVEPGINGVKIIVADSTGTEYEAVTGTDAFGEDGHWEIGELCPGIYSVFVDEESLPACVVPTMCETGDPTRDSECPGVIIELSCDRDEDRTVDFGFCPIREGVIGDLVWLDADCDGVRDSDESGVCGVSVLLVAPDGTETPTTSDDAGAYAFRGLCPGEYTVKLVDAPPCFTVIGGAERTVSLGVDSEVLGVDFGLCPGGTGSICDLVWFDIDKDGKQERGEPGLPGVRVVLLDKASGRSLEDRTDSRGHYEFKGLCAGDYEITVDETTLPDCFEETRCEAISDPALDSNCLPAAVSLEEGEIDKTIDFGYFSRGPGVIGDFVWLDKNKNGVQDGDEREEEGLPGVRVALCAVDGSFVWVQRTDTRGHYAFRGLCLGGYVLEVKSPDRKHLKPTECNVGTDDTIDSECSPVDVDLNEDSPVNHDIDFGFVEIDGDPGGGEGCSPGYWKQPHHFDSWPPPFRPDMLFSEVFEDAFPAETLLHVLRGDGGGIRALGRQVVAGLLNASSSRIDYRLSPDEVISAFDAFYPSSTESYDELTESLEALNTTHCPLD